MKSQSPQSVARWRATRWFERRRVPAQSVPASLRCGLLATGSLTALVRGYCQGEFDVQVLCHERRRPLPAEQRRLGMSAGCRALTRQVYLRCDGQPWVFAHSVIPPDSLRGSWRRLIHLGERPLGAALFADPAVRRSAMEIGWLRPGDALYDQLGRELTAGAQCIWGRRSLFWLHDAPLMVCEFFLPGFEKVLAGEIK